MTNIINQKLSNKIDEFLILAFHKPEFNKFERARILYNYMNKNKISLTELSKKLNIPITTLHDWVSYLNIKEDHVKLKEKGLTETDINNIVKCRHNKDYNINKEIQIINNKINFLLTKVKNIKYDEKEYNELTNVLRNLNTLLFRMEKKLIR